MRRSQGQRQGDRWARRATKRQRQRRSRLARAARNPAADRRYRHRAPCPARGRRDVTALPCHDRRAGGVLQSRMGEQGRYAIPQPVAVQRVKIAVTQEDKGTLGWGHRQRAVDEQAPERGLVMVAPARCDLPARQRPVGWHARPAGAGDHRSPPVHPRTRSSQGAELPLRQGPSFGQQRAGRSAHGKSEKSRAVPASTGRRDTPPPPLPGKKAPALRVLLVADLPVAIDIKAGLHPCVGPKRKAVRIDSLASASRSARRPSATPPRS